jgi:hypothetical protein
MPCQFFQDSEREDKSESADKVSGSLHLFRSCDLRLIEPANLLRVVCHIRAVQAHDSAGRTRPEIPEQKRHDVASEVRVVLDQHNCVCLILVVRQVSCGLNPVLEVAKLSGWRWMYSLANRCDRLWSTEGAGFWRSWLTECRDFNP